MIWASQLRTAGVDAKSVFWGRSARTDTYFDEWVPADKLAQADSVEFLMGHTPHDRWLEDWQKVKTGIVAAGQAVEAVVQLVKQIMQDIKVA